MTLVSDNIRYLRKLNGLTQEQFSRKINIKRSLLGAYEEGRANPNQQNIQAIAKAFNTTVELLTRQDLRKLRETPSLSIPLGQSNKSNDTYSARNERHFEPSIRSDGKLTSDDDPFQHPDFPDIFAQPVAPTPEPQPLSSVLNKYYKTQEEPRRTTQPQPPVPPVITSPVRPGQERPSAEHLFGLSPDSRPATSNPPARQPESLTFNNVYEEPTSSTRQSQVTHSMAPTIPVVMQRQFTEYTQRHQQADFLHRLPAMHLPTLPDGHYRAFEAGDEFVFPGALLVGRFVRNWFDIVDGAQYILLLQRMDGFNGGIQYRRVYNQVKAKGTLLLTADHRDIPNREVPLKEVIEVWEICAFVSQQLPPPTPNTDRLRQLVDELKIEVERL
ncbi:helix-turn-helix domain-containing protein [Spirosoma sp.]|uniref:helix-turn-helix domain-containing protein n=1 Tax=Spirosoma sp. TaxID=1899569 RepID=UPI003B3A8F0B